MSPGKSSVRPRKKWLKATSYRVAEEANEEMCPPTLVVEFAFTTMAMAFHRMMLLIRRSMSRSPGKGAWLAGEMVLM